MDGAGFDRLARALGARGTRRGVLATAAGLVAAVAGGAALADDGGANGRRTCRPVYAGCTKNGQCCSGLCETRRTTPRNHRNRCACPERIAICNGSCCAEGEECVDGQCVVPLPCGGMTCTPTGTGGYDSHCMVTTACEVAEGCDYEAIGLPIDGSNNVCETDADCVLGGWLSSYCVVGSQFIAADGTVSSEGFSYYDEPRCRAWYFPYCAA